MSITSKVKKNDSKITSRQEVVKVLNQLQCGEPFDFQFDAEGKKRIKCKLVGFEETNYLVFAVPTNVQQGLGYLLTSNHSCILRTIIERDSGLCLAFKSAITGMITKPYPLFFVHYPKTIECYKLRGEVRLSTHVPASIMSYDTDNEKNHDAYHGTIVDLSSTGCRFKLPWSTSADTFSFTDIIVNIIFPSSPETPLTVKGNIKGVTRYDKAHLSLGIKLEGTTELRELFNRLGLDQEK